MLTQDVSGARYRRILSDTEMQMSIESPDTAVARDKASGTHPFDRATAIRRGADRTIQPLMDQWCATKEQDKGLAASAIDAFHHGVSFYDR